MYGPFAMTENIGHRESWGVSGKEALQKIDSELGINE